MFDFDFCNALPVRAQVGSGTITAFYYYYYYYMPISSMFNNRMPTLQYETDRCPYCCHDDWSSQSV